VSGAGAEDLFLATEQIKTPTRRSADGRFLINTQLNDAAAPITLLQNWNPEIKK
jgi:hypothetical protein